MTRRHGIQSDTFQKLILDSGAVYTGFTGFASLGTLLGATRGGSSFTVEQEIKEIEVDGARGPVKGGRRITMIKASLTCNFLDHSLDSLIRALTGSSSANFESNWDAVTRSLVIADAAYLDDVTLVGEVSGEASDPMAIKLSNVLADGNFELTFEDKNEGVIPVTFTAHFDPSDLESGTDTEPWTLYWPRLST